MISTLKKFRSNPNVCLENIDLNFGQFQEVLSCNLPLLMQIFRNELIIPEFENFCESVTTLYHKLKDNFDGEVSKF